jgi:fermentation-respiration switch protein FrsA (DUF1100 family)
MGQIHPNPCYWEIKLQKSQILIQHGTRDATVPVQHSIELAAKLGQTIGENNVILELIDGADHEDPRFETPENIQKVLDFIDRTLMTPGGF